MMPDDRPSEEAKTQVPLSTAGQDRRLKFIGLQESFENLYQLAMHHPNVQERITNAMNFLGRAAAQLNDISKEDARDITDWLKSARRPQLRRYTLKTENGILLVLEEMRSDTPPHKVPIVLAPDIERRVTNEMLEQWYMTEVSPILGSVVELCREHGLLRAKGRHMRTFGPSPLQRPPPVAPRHRLPPEFEEEDEEDDEEDDDDEDWEGDE